MLVEWFLISFTSYEIPTNDYEHHHHVENLSICEAPKESYHS